jgi:hypothetical protein
MIVVAERKRKRERERKGRNPVIAGVSKSTAENRRFADRRERKTGRR